MILFVKWLTVENGTAERHLIRILQFITHGDTPGNDGELHIRIRRQLTGDIKVRRIPLHRGTEGEDHLVDISLRHTLHQGTDSEVTGTDTIHRRDDTAKDMIEAMILHCILHRHHILDIFHDTYGMVVTMRITADGTDIGVTDVMAYLTVFYILLQSGDGIDETVYLLLVLTEREKGKAQRRAPPYARQGGKGADGLLQEF